MSKKIGRRKFLKTLGTGAAIVIGAACAPAAAPTAAPKTEPKPAPTTAPAPAAAPTTAPAAAPTVAVAPAPAATAAAPAVVKPAAQGERLVVALSQWGTEQPFAWNSSAAEKPLWDHMHDSLMVRDPVTYKLKPGLALEWTPSSDYKTWTFKLRQGVMFHDTWGEMTAEDVKFTIDENLKPGRTGGSAPFFKDQLEKTEVPDKYTLVLRFKNPVWEVPTHFAQRTGYQNITSKKYLESVGEEKAQLHPIGTGPFKYVEGKQGSYHRFAAVPNHWRQTPGFKEMTIRKITDQASALAGLRAGEIDIAPLTGDFLAQAVKAGLRVHEVKGATAYIVVLPGQMLPDKPDYNPKLPWVGDPNDPKSQENAKKVRLALNLAVDKKEIADRLWQGYGALDPFVPWYYPHEPGFSQDWKVPPYDPQRAKQLLAEAGYPNGFEIKTTTASNVTDAADVIESVALYWEKLGIKVQRRQEDYGSLIPKIRARKDVPAWVYGTPGPTDEATLLWQRTVWSKGTFYIFAETPEYDQKLETILRELDPAKRAKLQAELGQKMYDDLRVVMLGVKSVTWAVSKRVKDWPTLVANLWENNFEYVTWTGQ